MACSCAFMIRVSVLSFILASSNFLYLLNVHPMQGLGHNDNSLSFRVLGGAHFGGRGDLLIFS